MTSGHGNALRTVAFGDSDVATWGVVVAAGGRPVALIAGADGSIATLDATLEAAGDDWRIAADGVELVVAPVAEPVQSLGSEAAQGGFDQLCRVEGRFTVDGAERAVASLGLRSVRDAGLETDGFEAMRQVLAWFEPADGLALTAFRPRGAKGQDADVISATVLNSEGSAPVEDPRLSTAYAPDGWVARAGLELWLGGDDDQQILRRAAGEAAGARGAVTAGDLELRAEPFRWHSGGRDGAGVYLLASRR